MSLARRQYNARGADIPEVTGTPDYVLAWDEEAQQAAIGETRRLSARDPAASQMLAEQVLAQPVRAAARQYDPAQTEAQLLLIAGLKPWEGDAMHFVRYFALVREVILAKERENAAYADQRTVNAYDPAFTGQQEVP